jgi:hypothetical protein
VPEAAAPPLKKNPADDVLFRPAAKKIQANLEMLLGAQTPMTVEPGRRVTGDEARTLPPQGGVCVVGSVAASDPESEIVVALDRNLALALACMLQMQPEGTVATRVQTPSDFDDAERESVGEVGNFLVAALAERVRDLVGADSKLAQIPTRFLDGAGAVSIEQALPASGYLVASGTLKPGALGAGSFVIFVADGLGKAAVARAYLSEEALAAAPTPGSSAPVAGGSSAPAPSAAPAVGAPVAPNAAAAASNGAAQAPLAPFDATGLVIMVAGSEAAFAERVEKAAPKGATVVRKPGLGAAVDAIEAGEPAAMVVVETPAGREHLVDFAGVARRGPCGRSATWLVALGRPTRRVVMRCASAGASGVVPLDAPQDVLTAKMTSLLRAASAAR